MAVRRPQRWLGHGTRTSLAWRHYIGGEAAAAAAAAEVALAEVAEVVALRVCYHVGVCLLRLAHPIRTHGLALGCHCDETTVSISAASPGSDTGPHAHGYGCARESLRARRGGSARRGVGARRGGIDPHGSCAGRSESDPRGDSDPRGGARRGGSTHRAVACALDDRDPLGGARHGGSTRRALACALDESSHATPSVPDLRN